MSIRRIPEHGKQIFSLLTMIAKKNQCIESSKPDDMLNINKSHLILPIECIIQYNAFWLTLNPQLLYNIL